jgi:RNA polymerase sigma factor (TIGR02999 family)
VCLVYAATPFWATILANEDAKSRKDSSGSLVELCLRAMRSDNNPGEITRLLHAWKGGSSEAQAELWPILYGELKKLARGVLRGQGRGARHEATSLVHKAYLRLLGSDVAWSDRRHFFAVAARAMRFVLADEARRQMARKRGDGETLTLDGTLAEVADPLARRPEEVLAVHQALTKLAGIQPRHEKLVELRYFAGLSVEETAEVLEVTPRTVVRDWKTVRVWLHGELRGTA